MILIFTNTPFYLQTDLLSADTADTNTDDHPREVGGHQQSDVTSVRYYHVIIVGVICFLLGGIVVFICLLHCHRFIFNSKDGATSPVVIKPTVVKTDGATVAALDYMFFPPVHPSYVRTTSPHARREDRVQNGGMNNPTTPQPSQMDFRQYYHRHAT